MSAKAGLRKHGADAEKALMKEFMQLIDMDVMDPLKADELTAKQKREALGMINMIKEKRNHTPEVPDLKGRACADGRPQKTRYTKEETASPTMSNDAFMIQMMINAIEGRDVAFADVAGAYLHAHMTEFVAMRITGAEVDIMCKLNPEWEEFVTIENGKRVLYVRLNKALYGCVQSALLWYKLFTTTLEGMGFEVNPYDMCVANAVINGKQCTICWYVDDNMISHMDKNVVSDTIKQIEEKFGKMTVSRGEEHEFLGMKITLSKKNNTAKINMKESIKEALSDFLEDVVKNTATPATRYLFNVKEDSPSLDEARAENFHSIAAKLLYISRRCRLDIQTALGYLTTRVSCPNEDDWAKLRRVLQYLRGTMDECLILGGGSIGSMESWVDAAYGVHNDMKSHTGGCMSWGLGVLLTMCIKQRLNVKSSTEAEVVGVSDFLPNMIWARMFIEAQGYSIDENILHQDNMSAMKIETNGRMSCGKKSRHIDARYFFIKDRLTSEGISVVHCPTGEMLADFFTKPLQGELFRRFKAVVMGHKHVSTLKDLIVPTAQERVGSDISNKAVSFDIRTVGKTTREPHKMSYLTAVKKSME
jgi:hypothetical protein